MGGVRGGAPGACADPRALRRIPEVDVSASKTCLVRFDRNRYSIEAKAANRPVQLRAYADRVVVRFDGEVVATNERVFGRDRVRYNPLHYLPVLARKPGALRNGAPFKDCELPPKTPCPNVKEKRKAGTRAGLTKPAIAAAAKLIESIGPNGFSLRKLAKALGVGPILLLMFFWSPKWGLLALS